MKLLPTLAAFFYLLSLLFVACAYFGSCTPVHTVPAIDTVECTR